MSYTAEITERSLPRDRQAVLTDVLVRELNVEPEEAALTALVMPVLVGPFASAADRDAFLVALAEAGFAARPGVDDAPAEVIEAPVYTPPAPVPPAYTPPAPPTEAYASAPASSSNGTIVAVAIVLGVIAAVLAAVVLTRDGQSSDETAGTDTPPGYATTEVGSEPMEVDEPAAPARTDDADFALGFSPRRGVNWDVFTQSEVVRYANAPNSTPIPVRDVPSARHGTAFDEIPTGGEVTTSGCLPRRPEDGGRWCRTDYAGGEGWVYDRHLVPSPPRAAAPRASGGVQVVRLGDGQTSLTLSEGGRTWRLPRPLSPGTSVSNVQRTTLAGRDVVQFTARDARWTTTYFWEARQGLLHFSGDDGRGTTNISEAPGSRAIIGAALGYVPEDDVVRGDGASRAPSRAPSRGRETVPNILVLGSYQPYDQAGLDARYAQAQRTGLTLQVVSSETYGMTPGLTVIVAGPYDRDTALRLLDGVRPYVPDAFRKALD